MNEFSLVFSLVIGDHWEIYAMIGVLVLAALIFKIKETHVGAKRFAFLLKTDATLRSRLRSAPISAILPLAALGFFLETDIERMGWGTLAAVLAATVFFLVSLAFGFVVDIGKAERRCQNDEFASTLLTYSDHQIGEVEKHVWGSTTRSAAFRSLLMEFERADDKRRWELWRMTNLMREIPASPEREGE